MTLDEIEALAADGESETLELKLSTGELRTGARTACAMLNHRGGTVLFGVQADGRVIGQFVSDRTLEEIAEELRNIEPPASPFVDRVTVGGGKEVLVITLSKGQNQPYSHRGKAWRRVANTSQAMSRDSTTKCFSNACMGSGAGKTNLLRDGESTISTATRSFEPSRKLSGAGAPTIREPAIQTNAGLPAPEIEDAGGCVTVRFRPESYVPRRVEREVTERQRAILSLLAGAPTGYALREIIPRLGDSPAERQVRDDLRILRTLGLAVCEGHGRGARWKRQ